MSLSYIFDIVCNSLSATIILFTMWSIFRYLVLKRKIKKCNIKNKFSRKKEFVLWLFVFYIIWLFQITVYRYGIDWSEISRRTNYTDNLNLIPLIEIIAVYKYGTTWAFIYNFIGNIVWFMPLGIMLPILKDNLNLIKTVIVGFLVSLSIEIMQYVFNTGLCDVDDIIINALGTALGYLVYKLIKLINKKVKKIKTI